MKIAQLVSLEMPVPPTSQNGLEFVVSWITEELVKRGHEVTLFATDESKTSGKLVSLIPQKILKSREMQWNQPKPEMWNISHVASRSSEFDIIHCHTQDISMFTPFIKTPIIQTLHHPFKNDSWLPDMAKEKEKKQMKFILDAISAIHFVAVSDNQEKHFEEASYFKKHSRIHNGIPVDKFTFNKTPKDYLLFIGYINENKGAHIAVQVAKKLGMKLILAGNTYGEEEFFKKNIEPYLNKDIQYVGPVDFEKKNALYGNAVATIAPLCWDEPFGLTIIESQACGTPVIAFKKGATSEIINHNETGFVVEDEKAMIDAIKKIGTIDRKACRVWAEKHFSIKHMVDQYEALYKTLISK